MAFSPYLAERRFGYGLSPVVQPPKSLRDMLTGVQGADGIRDRFEVPAFEDLQHVIAKQRRFATFARRNPDTTEGKAALNKSRTVKREMRVARNQWFAQIQMRRIMTPHAFRERLVAFWADHFTARGKNGLLRSAQTPYVEAAIRPHVHGRFADMLKAAVTHPLMLHYLDQNTSVGPNSRIAKRRNRDLGLNENLAREVLELHTLGVHGPYNQDDVRGLANLLTGLGATRNYGFKFRPGMAEPGAEVVLGRTYGGPIGLAPIVAALSDLAHHPATAGHIAQKLARHFLADNPPVDLVAQIEHAFHDTDGDLMTVYEALLDHPLAWNPAMTNIRPPEEYVSTALRALAPPADRFEGLTEGNYTNLFWTPLRLMGQPWQQSPGPDGWAEEDEAWVTPQGIAARLEWVMSAPSRLLSELPDPIELLGYLFPDGPAPRTAFAAQAAESRAQAVGLILIAPEVQRR